MQTEAMPSCDSIAALLRDFTRGSDSSSMAAKPLKAAAGKDAASKTNDISTVKSEGHGNAPADAEAPQRRHSPAPAGPVGSPDGRRRLHRMMHTNACEEGGLTMLELSQAMRRDAKAQEFLTGVVAEMLEETIARNDARKRKGELASFEGSRAPISPASYVRRIIKYGGCSPCCFAVGVLYLERLKRRHTKMCLTSCNFQRLFLTAVMLAAKYLDDFYYSNKHWAEVAGISTNELNALELEMLFRMDFNLSIRREDYDAFIQQLVGPEDDMDVEFKAESHSRTTSDDPSPKSSAAADRAYWRVGEHAGEHAGLGGKRVSSVELASLDEIEDSKASPKPTEA